MLTVCTCHSQKCPHKNDIAWRRRRCPKWIQGIPNEDHEFLRTSAQTRTWERAEEKARKREEDARLGAHKPAPVVTIAEAVAAYRADEAARCLSKSTTNQSKTLFQFVALTDNTASSDYHSLQLKYQARLSRELQALASYSFSHSIDNASTDGLRLATIPEA